MIQINRNTSGAKFKTKRLCAAMFSSLVIFGASHFATAEKNTIPTAANKVAVKAQSSSASSSIQKFRPAPASRAVAGQYIVVLKDEYVRSEVEKLANSQYSSLSTSAARNYKKRVVEGVSDNMASRYGAEVTQQFSNTVNGYTAKMTRSEMEQMLNESSVNYIEQDQVVSASDIQNNATFGLDRIDQSDLPLNGQYEFEPDDGLGVDVFVIDTGILASHPDFDGRVDTAKGFNAVNDNFGTEDCEGHGTHVAGTVGSEIFGVAKEVTLVPVRVLGCDGRGFNSDVIAGVDHVTNTAEGPTVANMSLGGGRSAALDAAVQRSIDAGITYVVAAGNDNEDACLSSPARLPDAITVGASDANDNRSGFSNFGSCVDIFAPGSAIESTFNNGGFARLSGTSMASPHVAGVAALVLQDNPEATPAEVTQIIEAAAAVNKLNNVNGSPNLLLQSNIDGADEAPARPTPEPVADNCDVQESFENGAGGWFIDEASTCATGGYVVGQPTQQVTDGLITQIGGANTGANAAFTATNESVGADDVDGGNCIARSPVYSVTADSTLSMAVFHGQRDSGDDPEDFISIDVSVDGGNNFTTIAANGDNRFSAANWNQLSVNVSSGDEVVVRVQCSDGATTGDIIECGIDDVNICSN